jgi:hypothetical protein
MLKGDSCAESNLHLVEELVSTLFKQLDPIYDYHENFLREVCDTYYDFMYLPAASSVIRGHSAPE